MSPLELENKFLDGTFRLKGDFANEQAKRQNLIDRCEKYAGWTLPHLFPDENFDDNDESQYDYQSVGAQAVTHLGNKVMMALFQPSRPFYRNDLTDNQRNEIKAEFNLDDTKIDKALSDGERAAMKLFNSTNNRAVLTDLTMLLIITGNALLDASVTDGMKFWSIRDYVIQRDLSGNFTRIIFRETKAVVALDDDLAAVASAFNYHKDDEVTFYTCIQRVSKNRFLVHQEMEDVTYSHDVLGIYNKDTLPWIPLVWNRSRNKDYGTGLVENYAGAFHTISTLAEAILDYTTILTDVKTLVDPTGMTDVERITKSPSGSYVPGREEDLFVHAPQVGAQADFLDKRFEAAARQIAMAFLMNTAVTRDAERVTAEEIRQQANELESSLGGVYSRLANDLQLPLAKRLSREIDEAFEDIEPIIITGLESLSRLSDLDRLRLFFQDAVALADIPDRVAERLDFEALLNLLGTGHQVEHTKFMLSEDQVKANRRETIEQNAAAAGQEAGAVATAQQG